MHAPTIEAEVDAERIATALAHLVADVAGVDATGKTPQGSGYMDSTIVVAAAQRGEVVRIEVRGPYEGGNPVHEPIVRGIVAAHGGVLQTVEVPGAPGGAYVLELPLGAGAGTVTLPEPVEPPAEEPGAGGGPAKVSGGRRARRGVDSFLDDSDADALADPGAEAGAGTATGADDAGRAPVGGGALALPSGRRRGGEARPGDGAPAELAQSPVNPAGLGVTGPGTGGNTGTGRRRGQNGDGGNGNGNGNGGNDGGAAQPVPPQGTAMPALPPVPTGPLPAPPVPLAPVPLTEHPAGRRRTLGAAGPVPPAGGPVRPGGPVPAAGLTAPAAPRPIAPEGGFALPPGPTSAPGPQPPQSPSAAGSASAPAEDDAEAPGGRRGRRVLSAPPAEPEAPAGQPDAGAQGPVDPETHPTGRRRGLPATPAWPVPAARNAPEDEAADGQIAVPGSRQPQDTPAEAAGAPISVRALGTLGQGISTDTNGSGRRRRLAEPAPQGRAFAIGAPEAGSDEGPEPLDGPGGAVEVVNRPVPRPVDDELPPEPLDNPRRLLVWPAPDVQTQAALSDRGYRPVIVHSREEVDAQIAAFPAALFVDPLTGPITRTALQSLRQVAVAAEVPVLVTAGLGHATREAAYGADPAVLLKALAPRDSEQHPSRVLLIEEHDEIATALTAALERRGMQVARADADTDAVELASRMRPNLVVMDLMQVRRRRAGIVDWLRANGQLNHTPLVVYTATGIDPAELPRLASGESVLFLAERSTTADVQGRIVDLLAKIGTN